MRALGSSRMMVSIMKFLCAVRSFVVQVSLQDSLTRNSGAFQSAGSRYEGIALTLIEIGGLSSTPTRGCTGLPWRYDCASLKASHAMRGSLCARHLRQS